MAGTAAHLTDPDQVYFLTMEGLLFEASMTTLAVRLLFDLTKELDWTEGAYLHFKAIHTGHGRVVVANNTFEEPEYLGSRQAGRLAEWDGSGAWTILERNPFIEVSGNQTAQVGDYFGSPLYAVGWDHASVILRVLHKGEWKRYRLPFGSASWMHTWNTEWMRIRFAQTERLLMDAFGIFYDLPNLVYGGQIMPIRPICTHLRVVPDFVHFNGYFVMGSDQVDHTTGQPQSGLWWGSIDDLHRFGRPSGFGALWRNESPTVGAPSDPYLMGGFDKKSVHLTCEPGAKVVVDLEVDPTGSGEFRRVATLEAVDGYAYHVFEAGFAAHWLRARVRRADGPSTLTVHYQ